MQAQGRGTGVLTLCGTGAEPVAESCRGCSKAAQGREQACLSSSHSSPPATTSDRRFDAPQRSLRHLSILDRCSLMASIIASLQTWVSDTLVESFGLVYVLIGALVGVAHGSVHGVQTLAPAADQRARHQAAGRRREGCARRRTDRRALPPRDARITSP